MQDIVSLHEGRLEAAVFHPQETQPRQPLANSSERLIASALLNSTLAFLNCGATFVVCGTPPRTTLSSRPAHVFRGERQ